jgi:hypothetical protein
MQKNQEQPTPSSTTNTRWAEVSGNPEDNSIKTLSHPSCENLHVAAPVVDQAKLLREAPPPKCVSPDGKTNLEASNAEVA